MITVDPDGPVPQPGPVPHRLSRRWLGLASVLLFLLFAALAARVYSGSTPLRVDRAASRVANSATLTQAVHGLSRTHPKSVFNEVANLGSPVLALGVAGALAAMARHRHDRLAMILCLAGPVVAVVLTELVAKPVVHRHMGNALTYPSGHTTDAASVATVVVLVLWRWHGWRMALRWAPVVAMVPLAVSLAVVRLRWHFATDALGGIAVGVASVLGVAAILPDARPLTRPAEPELAVSRR